MARIVVIDGHPDPSEAPLNHALAERYAEAAQTAGAEVRRIDVASMDFPVLRRRDDFYAGRPPEAIRDAQQDIAWADHLVFVFPLWIGDVPALLKAFIEQTFRPGFAFDATSPRSARKLLAGKTARIVITMAMPAIVYRTLFGAHMLKSFTASLRMCGVAPVSQTLIGNVEAGCERTKAGWFDTIAKAAERDATGRSGGAALLPLVFGAGALVAASYLAYAALTWARYGRTKPGDSLLDGVMPDYEVGVYHEVEIAAAADVAFDAMHHTEFERSPIVQALFRAREVLLGARGTTPNAAPQGLIERLTGLGWSIVAEEPGRELVFGTITQPWQSQPVFRSVAKDEFAAFNRPGYAKIAFTLRVDPTGERACRARTETRVQTTDPLSRARFRGYWALLSPGIELIRIVLLQRLKTEAEAREGSRDESNLETARKTREANQAE